MKKLLVSPILLYIKFWAKVALLIHKPITIGVAGSVGKSSTRNALFAILKNQAKTKMISGNSETGVPLGILNLDIASYSPAEWLKIILLCPFKIFSLNSYKYLIVEMGIDDPFPPKNMTYLLSIIKPDISISLNVAATHTFQFEKLLYLKPTNENKSDFLLRKIAEEDTKIILNSGCRIGIYNSDDKFVSHALTEYKGKTLTFGENGDATFGTYMVGSHGTDFEIIVGEKRFSIKIENQALPLVYREVFAAVLLASHEAGVSLETAAKSLSENFSLPKGRCTILSGIKNSLIIDSSYNSSKVAVLTFLELLNRIAKNDKRTAVFLMGDMRELGEEAAREHKEVAKKINETVDILYCVGPLTEEYIIPNIDPKIERRWFADSKRAAEHMKQNLADKSVILVKGSQNEIFLEEAIKPLLKDSSDSKKLCRQTSYWIKIKNNFFAER